MKRLLIILFAVLTLSSCGYSLPVKDERIRECYEKCKDNGGVKYWNFARYSVKATCTSGVTFTLTHDGME